MWDVWYNFFYSHLFSSSFSMMDDIEFNYGTSTLFMNEYLSGLMATIMVIFIYIMCCLCVWKVIRLFGRLWSRF